jgi:hypothetical protein
MQITTRYLITCLSMGQRQIVRQKAKGNLRNELSSKSDDPAIFDEAGLPDDKEKRVSLVVLEGKSKGQKLMRGLPNSLCRETESQRFRARVSLIVEERRSIPRLTR